MKSPDDGTLIPGVHLPISAHLQVALTPPEGHPEKCTCKTCLTQLICLLHDQLKQAAKHQVEMREQLAVRERQLVRRNDRVKELEAQLWACQLREARTRGNYIRCMEELGEVDEMRLEAALVQTRLEQLKKVLRAIELGSTIHWRCVLTPEGQPLLFAVNLKTVRSIAEALSVRADKVTGALNRRLMHMVKAVRETLGG